MVEYHLAERSHEAVMSEAAARGIGVVVKKGLASGHLSAGEAIRFVLANADVASLIVGGLSLEHFRENVKIASDIPRIKSGEAQGLIKNRSAAGENA